MQDLKFDNANVMYDERFLAGFESEKLFSYFSRIFMKEKQHVVTNNMKSYRLNRKTMVFIDPLTVNKDVIPKIWGDNVTVKEFPPDLISIKEKIEHVTNFKFNICLANYYDTGKNTIGYHSDNEEKGSTSCIASISVGAERMFSFREKKTHKIYKEMRLKNGSLFIMGDGCQENYEHSILHDDECDKPRLNLTFRLFDPDRYSKH